MSPLAPPDGADVDMVIAPLWLEALALCVNAPWLVRNKPLADVDVSLVVQESSTNDIEKYKTNST